MTSSFFAALINESGDALDHLEKASFFATLVPDAKSGEALAGLSTMAEIAQRCSQEFLKTLMSAREVQKRL